jgi:hypothetical protein
MAPESHRQIAMLLKLDSQGRTAEHAVMQHLACPKGKPLFLYWADFFLFRLPAPFWALFVSRLFCSRV